MAASSERGQGAQGEVTMRCFAMGKIIEAFPGEVKDYDSTLRRIRAIVSTEEIDRNRMS